MPRRIALLVAVLLAIGGALRHSHAEELRVSLPDDVKFAVRVNVPAIRDSEVAGKLFADAKDKLRKKLADKKEGEGLSLEKIVEILGFDPFEEIQSVMVAGADFESPEASLVGCVQLRKTTGNIEGLLLALPGYKAEEYSGTQIHSATPEDDTPVYGAIHTGASGNRTVLLAVRREAIVQMLDSLSGKRASGAKDREVTLGGAGSVLSEFDVYEIPAEMMELEGPPANVAKIVRTVSARVTESDGKLNVAVAVVTDAEKQAGQLEQMVKGLTAMLDLVVPDAEDEELQKLRHMAKGLTTKRNGSTLELNLSLPADEVRALIEENVHDK